MYTPTEGVIRKLLAFKPVDASRREERRKIEQKRSERIIGMILGAVLGAVSLGAIGTGATLLVARIPWWHGAGLGFAGGFVVGLVMGLVPPMQRPIKRACLALGVFEFQRSYWLGGIISLVALLSTFSEDPPWFVEWFAGRWVGYVVIGAFIAPPIFTAISELAFWAILRWGKTQDGPLPSLVWADDPAHGFLPAEGTKLGLRIDLDLDSLVRIDFEPGGLKRIVACFVANVYRSHFFSYVPYAVDLDLRGRQNDLMAIKRGVLLARTADAEDFQKHGYMGFEYIQVCPFCWVLFRRPIVAEIHRVEDSDS